jgi:DNA gyrase/topoisomerase IV subunit A
MVDGLIALIDKADLTDAELWRYIPEPDFPTGEKFSIVKA